MYKICLSVTALSLLLSTTLTHAAASDDTVPSISPQIVAEMYNSHFDFARSMHSLDIEKLAAENLATQIPSKHYEVSYQIHFDEPYTDVYGNQYTGNILYQKTHKEVQVGDIEHMEFQNFQINDIQVSGAKVSTIHEVSDGETRRSNWCPSRCRVAGGQVTDTLTMHLPNQVEMALDGQFGKRLRYDIAGQKQILVDGQATATIDGQTFHFAVNQPMTMTGTCRWMQDGSISMQDHQQHSLGTIQLSASSCNGNYQIAHLNGHADRHARQHNLWN